MQIALEREGVRYDTMANAVLVEKAKGEKGDNASADGEGESEFNLVDLDCLNLTKLDR